MMSNADTKIHRENKDWILKIRLPFWNAARTSASLLSAAARFASRSACSSASACIRFPISAGSTSRNPAAISAQEFVHVYFVKIRAQVVQTHWAWQRTKDSGRPKCLKCSKIQRLRTSCQGSSSGFSSKRFFHSSDERCVNLSHASSAASRTILFQLRNLSLTYILMKQKRNVYTFVWCAVKESVYSVIFECPARKGLA